MKYFLDSAKLDEIKFAYEHYCIAGVTTNPKHIKPVSYTHLDVYKSQVFPCYHLGLRRPRGRRLCGCPTSRPPRALTGAPGAAYWVSRSVRGSRRVFGAVPPRASHHPAAFCGGSEGPTCLRSLPFAHQRIGALM